MDSSENMDSPENMDSSDICRTCIKTFDNTDLNPIFLSEDTHERCSSTFYACTGVQVKINDGLPQKMCTTCMDQFNNTLNFRKQCKEAETQLLKIKTELESKTREEQPTIKRKITIQKSDSQNFTNIKSEFQSIENETLQNNIEEDQPLKYLACENLLLKFNDLKHNDVVEINTEENSDTEFFNEDTVSYENAANFITENSVPQNSEDDKRKTYSRIPQYYKNTKRKSKELTLSDNELNISETLSDSNVTDKQNIDIPYIITDTATKKTMRVVCKLCQKELSIRSIDSHMMRRHPGADERKVKCELCDKYVMKEKLNRHRVMMHGNVGFRCGYCKSEFNSKEALVDHVATCTAKNRKRKVNDSGRALAECDICMMKMQRASLNKHKAVTHAGLRPVCEHCGKSFGNKFRLNEHYRAKHGYEKFQCRDCDFRSAGIMAMRNHERLHRGEKPFVCETCDAKFHAAYLLMQHKHSHRTEKLVKCDLCPASFKANNNLHMHKLTCHSKSYYSCALCDRSYKCRYYAVKHVRLAHNVSDATHVIKLMSQ